MFICTCEARVRRMFRMDVSNVKAMKVVHKDGIQTITELICLR